MSDEVRVVVVDDQPDAADMLASALRLDGYKVFTARDGNDALAVIAEHRPLCVLLDVDMPGLDGCELSRQLRALYGNDMVLIAMSGRDETDARVEETFRRVDYYLRKPFDLTRLKKVLGPVSP
jgi:DNA-binding response OmpR family regulator